MPLSHTPTLHLFFPPYFLPPPYFPHCLHILQHILPLLACQLLILYTQLPAATFQRMPVLTEHYLTYMSNSTCLPRLPFLPPFPCHLPPYLLPLCHSSPYNTCMLSAFLPFTTSLLTPSHYCLLFPFPTAFFYTLPVLHACPHCLFLMGTGTGSGCPAWHFILHTDLSPVLSSLPTLLYHLHAYIFISSFLCFLPSSLPCLPPAFPSLPAYPPALCLLSTYPIPSCLLCHMGHLGHLLLFSPTLLYTAATPPSPPATTTLFTGK